jgi:hypothetical protein
MEHAFIHAVQPAVRYEYARVGVAKHVLRLGRQHDQQQGSESQIPSTFKRLPEFAAYRK